EDLGAFIKARIGVCSDWVTYYHFLCLIKGFPVYIIESVPLKHAINAVKYKGEWYCIDVMNKLMGKDAMTLNGEIANPYTWTIGIADEEEGEKTQINQIKNRGKLPLQTKNLRLTYKEAINLRDNRYKWKSLFGGESSFWEFYMNFNLFLTDEIYLKLNDEAIKMFPVFPEEFKESIADGEDDNTEVKEDAIKEEHSEGDYTGDIQYDFNGTSPWV
ncbi:MAG: hypothetical protein LBD41_06420, partial [Clostridiales Family XIII bacterium]|nr:hypothetical protein [Clostridiales Family XIII bacterium]